MISPDLRLKPLAPEEERRRRTAKPASVKMEKWFRKGQSLFKANCAPCHGINAGEPGKNQIGLTAAELENNGYKEPGQVQYVLRYGVDKKIFFREWLGKMPGFAIDCADWSPFGQCVSAEPLSEVQLRDITDYMWNRINSDWKD